MLSANMYEYVDVVSFNQHIGWYRNIKDATKMTWEKPYYNLVIVIKSVGRAKYVWMVRRANDGPTVSEKPLL